MKNIFLFLFGLIMLISQVNAQDFEFDEEDNSGNAYYKTKYKKEKINDTYDFYYNKDINSYKRKYGLLKNGKKFFPDIFNKSQLTHSKTKLILSINRLYGLYNLESEKWDIPIKYETLSHIKNGLYKVKQYGKYGIVDANDNIIINFDWVGIESIYNIDNYYIVKEKIISNKYGLLSIVDKKLTIPCEYSSLQKDKNSNYFKVKKDNKYNLVDINNKPMFKQWYNELYLPSGGRKLYIVKLNDKMGIVDGNGNPVVPIEYKSIRNNPYKDGSHLAQNKDGMYGCISLDGRITLPFKYSNIETGGYSNSIIAMNDGKCGIVHINDGMPYEVTTCDYNNIEGRKKLFIVEKDNKFGMLDLYGNIITEIIYDKIESLSNSNSYYSSSKLFIAKKGDKYFFLNNTGEIVNETYYRFIKPLYSLNSYNNYNSDNSYLIVKGENNKFGLVDLFGKEVIPQSFDDIITRQDNFVIVKKNNKVGLYNIFKKKIILPTEYDQIFLSKTGFITRLGNDFYKIIIDDDARVEKL